MAWLDEKSEYEMQPRGKRITLWLRYMPLAYLRFLVRLVSWFAGGMKPIDPDWTDARWETIDVLWSCSIGEAQMRMGHCYELHRGERPA